MLKHSKHAGSETLMAVQKTPWTRVNAKVCCTCEYWDGERELQFLPGVRLNAILAQFNPQGRCTAKMNCLMSYSNPGAAYCPTYKRWHKLP